MNFIPSLDLFHEFRCASGKVSFSYVEVHGSAEWLPDFGFGSGCALFGLGWIFCIFIFRGYPCPMKKVSEVGLKLQSSKNNRHTAYTKLAILEEMQKEDEKYASKKRLPNRIRSSSR